MKGDLAFMCCTPSHLRKSHLISQVRKLRHKEVIHLPLVKDLEFMPSKSGCRAYLLNLFASNEKRGCAPEEESREQLF